MAGSDSNYHRGDMPIEAQKSTFNGFMATTIYCTAYIVCALLPPILIFGANLGWFTSIVVTVVVGIIIGMALKLKSFWYATLIAAAIITIIFCFIFTALTGVGG